MDLEGRTDTAPVDMVRTDTDRRRCEAAGDIDRRPRAGAVWDVCSLYWVWQRSCAPFWLYSSDLARRPCDFGAFSKKIAFFY